MLAKSREKYNNNISGIDYYHSGINIMSSLVLLIKDSEINISCIR